MSAAPLSPTPLSPGSPGGSSPGGSPEPGANTRMGADGGWAAAELMGLGVTGARAAAAMQRQVQPGQCWPTEREPLTVEGLHLAIDREVLVPPFDLARGAAALADDIADFLDDGVASSARMVADAAQCCAAAMQAAQPGGAPPGGLLATPAAGGRGRVDSADDGARAAAAPLALAPPPPLRLPLIRGPLPCTTAPLAINGQLATWQTRFDDADGGLAAVSGAAAAAAAAASSTAAASTVDGAARAAAVAEAASDPVGLAGAAARYRARGARAAATRSVNKVARAFGGLQRELGRAFATIDFQAIQMQERETRCETLEHRVAQFQQKLDEELKVRNDVARRSGSGLLPTKSNRHDTPLKARDALLLEKDEHRRLLVVNARKLKERCDLAIAALRTEVSETRIQASRAGLFGWLVGWLVGWFVCQRIKMQRCE